MEDRLSPSAAYASRPAQTSLLGEREKPVGPLPGSVVVGDNATLIAAVAPLYLTGSVLDVTYGRGMWWRRFSPATFGKHDLALDGVDFRDLPDEDGSWDAVCFDPPYVPTRAAATASPALKGRFRSSYGLNEPRNKAELCRIRVLPHRKGPPRRTALSRTEARRVSVPAGPQPRRLPGRGSGRCRCRPGG